MFRSTLKPAAFRDKIPILQPVGSVIRQEQPLSEKAALNPNWVEWLMGFPPKWTDASFGVPSPKDPPHDRDTDNRALRLKPLGTRSAPPQAYPIFQYIAMIETGACADICPYGTGGDAP